MGPVKVTIGGFVSISDNGRAFQREKYIRKPAVHVPLGSLVQWKRVLLNRVLRGTLDQVLKHNLKLKMFAMTHKKIGFNQNEKESDAVTVR